MPIIQWGEGLGAAGQAIGVMDGAMATLVAGGAMMALVVFLERLLLICWCVASLVAETGVRLWRAVAIQMLLPSASRKWGPEQWRRVMWICQVGSAKGDSKRAELVVEGAVSIAMAVAASLPAGADSARATLRAIRAVGGGAQDKAFIGAHGLSIPGRPAIAWDAMAKLSRVWA